MANESYDNIPMDDHPEEDFPVDEEITGFKKRGGGKKVLGKILFLLLILAILIGGFFLWQVSILDLEAQAQLSAARTVTAEAGIIIPTAEATMTPAITITPIQLTPTITPDSNLIHTATVAALLTEAAQ